MRREFHDELRSSTIITIASRITTIVKSDKVLVLKDGVAAEYDTPQSLLQDDESLLSQFLRDMREKRID